MATVKKAESFIRIEVSRAVRQLRDRLRISQARLAQMVGPEVSAITVSRWERGALLPYPKNRQKLADAAIDRGWWDIAAALNVPVPFDDWLVAVKANLPEDYGRWMKLAMCGLYGSMFEPDDPENPTDQEAEIAAKFSAMIGLADDLLNHLAGLHATGTEVIAPPPNEHFRQFWWNFLERRGRRGRK